MRISDWSSDVCSSDLEPHKVRMENMVTPDLMPYRSVTSMLYDNGDYPQSVEKAVDLLDLPAVRERQARGEPDGRLIGIRSEEHTSELQSLMRISYAVFCLKKKKHKTCKINNTNYDNEHETVDHVTIK